MTAVQRIRRDIRKHLPELSRRYGIRSLGLFGSYARGVQRPGSDLDLLVEFDAPIGLLRFAELERRLSEAAGVKVDLVMKSALKARIGRRILEEVVPL